MPFCTSLCNTFPLCHSVLLHITSFLNVFVQFSLHVWITWVVSDIRWKCQINSIFRNIFTEKNGDVFNTYVTCCIHIPKKWLQMFQIHCLTSVICWTFVIQRHVGRDLKDTVRVNIWTNITNLIVMNGIGLWLSSHTLTDSTWDSCKVHFKTHTRT